MPSSMTVTATATMATTTIFKSLNSVIETTTTPLNAVLQESITTSSALPNLIKTTTAAASNQIIQNNTVAAADDDQIIFHFGWIDYGLFVALLGISTMIGIFYGFFSKHKQNNISEYIFGGRSMQILPVAISMTASHISGQTFVGIPTEVYTHGTQYIVFVIAAISSGWALAYVSLPQFHRMGLTSTFEYLERRFDRRIRLLGSFMYVLKYIGFIPVVIYIPSLAFSQASGLDLHFVAPIICSVCIFYTTFGGLRAVVWADFIQFLLMMFAIVTVVVLGMNKVGGFANVWSAAERGGRLIIFNMDPSPFLRTSFWTMSLGLSLQWTALTSFGQSNVQRFLSLPDLKSAQKGILYFSLGMIFIKFFAIFLGLCIYANYEHCDPKGAGDITRSDQIVPLFVIQVGQKLPGISGLFIAGIFAASLATMSGYLNTLSGTIYMDFVRPCLSKQTEKQASTKVKLISVAIGILVTSLVFVVEHLGSVFEVVMKLSGILAGSMFTMFVLGMASRSANTKGLIIGVISSCLLLFVMFIGAQLNHIAKDPTLPVQTDECPNNDLIKHHLDQHHLQNSTAIQPDPRHINGSNNSSSVFWLFRISFMLYPVIGFAVSMVIGQVVSWLTGGHKQQIDENLLIPFFQSAEFRQRQRRQQQQENGTRYTTIDQMLVEMMKKEEELAVEEKRTTTTTINGNEYSNDRRHYRDGDLDHGDDDDDQHQHQHHDRDDEAIVTVADVKSTTN